MKKMLILLATCANFQRMCSFEGDVATALPTSTISNGDVLNRSLALGVKPRVMHSALREYARSGRSLNDLMAAGKEEILAAAMRYETTRQRSPRGRERAGSAPRARKSSQLQPSEAHRRAAQRAALNDLTDAQMTRRAEELGVDSEAMFDARRDYRWNRRSADALMRASKEDILKAAQNYKKFLNDQTVKRTGARALVRLRSRDNQTI